MTIGAESGLPGAGSVNGTEKQKGLEQLDPASRGVVTG
jgi:hypothetical protein